MVTNQWIPDEYNKIFIIVYIGFEKFERAWEDLRELLDIWEKFKLRWKQAGSCIGCEAFLEVKIGQLRSRKVKIGKDISR